MWRLNPFPLLLSVVVYFIIIVVITLVMLVGTCTLGHDCVVCYLYINLPYYCMFPCCTCVYMCVHVIFSFMVLPVLQVTTCMLFGRKLIISVINNLFSHWRLSNWAVKEKWKKPRELWNCVISSKVNGKCYSW